jgi:hypothetical protein
MINAEDANKLSLANQEKYELKKAKRLQKDMKRIHGLVVSDAKDVLYQSLWNFTNTNFDTRQIEELLIAEGFNIIKEYPFIYITWGMESEITHKRFT